LTIPVFVDHAAPNITNPEGEWNEGVGNNLGGIVSLTTEFASVGDASFYGGPVVGHVTNSFEKPQSVLGGVIGVDVPVGEHGTSMFAEAMAAAANGFGNEGNGFDDSALAPYGSLNVGIMQEFNVVNVGVAASWLPARTAAEAVGEAPDVAQDASVLSFRIEVPLTDTGPKF